MYGSGTEGMLLTLSCLICNALISGRLTDDDGADDTNTDGEEEGCDVYVFYIFFPILRRFSIFSIFHFYHDWIVLVLVLVLV
mmetsp:Transcript_2653/g.3759  ORF Transcript_2653/g.3759 Transcript_2653/m.3759 type:complete len:82 (-) Transcript_2653:677-922(-)